MTETQSQGWFEAVSPCPYDKSSRLCCFGLIVTTWVCEFRAQYGYRVLERREIFVRFPKYLPPMNLPSLQDPTIGFSPLNPKP